MNILCIAPSTPIPITGGRRHVYNVLKLLSKTHSIFLISTEDKNIDANVKEKFPLDFLKSFNQYSIRYTSSKKEKILSIIGFWREFNRFNTKEVSKNIQQKFLTLQPDLILIQELCMVEPTLKALSHIDTVQNTPILCVAHNDEAQLVKSKGLSKNLLIKMIYSFASHSATRYQSKWLNKITAVVCLTPEDNNSIKQSITNPSIKFFLFGNGVDTAQFKADIKPINEKLSNTIIFMGDYTYPPNFDSISWFINTVLPHIKQKLVLIGLPPTNDQMKVFTHNQKIIFKGLVEDVTPHLEQADICIAPILAGSGSRLKILEYLSMGKVVFSTSLGVQGLHLENNKHFVECNSPKDFIESCNDFIVHPEKYKELGTNGRKFIVENWDWNVLIPKFEAFLLQLVDEVKDDLIK